jgi:putative glutamine amidotransferase
VRGAVGCVCLLAVASACRQETASAPSAARPSSGHKVAATTVLVTHPSAKVLRDLRFLVANRVLDLPNLRLVGIYHERALRNWQEAQRYLRRVGLEWISLRLIRCKLPARRVFHENDCSSAIRELVETSRGIIFTGGPDLPPWLYGQPTRLTTRATEARRNLFEASFLYHLIGSTKKPKARGSERTSGQPAGLHAPSRHPMSALLEAFPDYVVLAICLGMETLNVVAGGTLVQDIPSDLHQARTVEQQLSRPREKQHACYDHLVRSSLSRKLWTTHPVHFTNQWSFTELARTRTVDVVSAHHQAIGELGHGLVPLAHSTDGKVIEAVGHERFGNLLGVQFHPEYSKAFVAQRQCLGINELTNKPTYVLNEKMIEYYQQFWRSFARKLLPAERSSHRGKRAVESAR